MTTINIDTNSEYFENFDNENIIMPPKSSFRVGNTVITVDSKYMFCRAIISECLLTYDLSDMDYAWGIDNIVPIVMDDPSIEYRWDKLLLFILHGCRQVRVGLLSFVYRYEIKNAIKTKSIDKLVKLLNLIESERWPEKTYNDRLTNAEINNLDIMKNKEVAALSNLISEGRTMNPPYLDGFIVCSTDPLATTNNNNLFTQCYNNICFKDTSDLPSNDNMVNVMEVGRMNGERTDEVPTCIFLDDTSQNTDNINNTRCYSLEDILELLTTNNIGELDIFKTEEKELQLRSYLYTEIKLYHGYLNYIALLSNNIQ